MEDDIKIKLTLCCRVNVAQYLLFSIWRILGAVIKWNRTCSNHVCLFWRLFLWCFIPVRLSKC